MLEFRGYEAADLPGCLDLIRVGHTHSFGLDRFQWLHAMSPGGVSAIALCTCDEDIVGIYSVIRKAVRLGSHVYRGGRDVDPVVHPAYRGRGVFTRLLEYGLRNFKDLDFCFNFANPLSAHGFRRAGWTRVTTLDDRVFQLGFDSAFSARAIAWLATGALRRRVPDASVREINHQEASQLLLESSGQRNLWRDLDRLSVDRSIPYLRWRYFLNPLHRPYRWFLRGPIVDPVGLVVCSFDDERNRLIVLDALGFGAPPKLGHWLECWAHEFPKSWVGTWSTMPSDLTEGFVTNPLSRGKGQPFLVRPFPGGEAPPQLLDARSWFITCGDLEIM
jgi:GNAT superfamily N-acetyltransferase